MFLLRKNQVKFKDFLEENNKNIRKTKPKI